MTRTLGKPSPQGGSLTQGVAPAAGKGEVWSFCGLADVHTVICVQ